MRTIENQVFDTERAFFGENDLLVKNCSFDGPADGESAFKECERIEVDRCLFNLRYPFWHDEGIVIGNSEMTESCRAPFWYSRHVEVTDSRLHGIKAFRECDDVIVRDSDIVSSEFGWSVRGMDMDDTSVEGEYFMMRSMDLSFRRVKLKGKYSFQYVENGVFEDCEFDTKDAFWHARNIIVRNSILRGEYLGWYSDGLTLVGCTVIGTQPLCYCRNLRMRDCVMVDADLAFEKSDVDAVIISGIASIRNPGSGRIVAESIDELVDCDAGNQTKIVIGAEKDCNTMAVGSSNGCNNAV